MTSHSLQRSMSASPFTSVVRLAAVVGILVAPWLFAPGAQARSASAAARRNVSKVECLQPPANVDLTTLSDAQLALYGLPPHPRTADRLAWWQNTLRNTKHRACTATGSMRKYEIPQAGRMLSPQFAGYANSNIWAGVVDTGSGYQAVSGNWDQPPIGTNGPSSAYVWVGVGGAYGIVPNDGPLVQAGTDSYYFLNQDTGKYEFVYDDFVEVNQNVNGVVSDWQINFTLPNQASYNDYMSAYVSSNYDYPGYNYFFVQDVTRTSYYGCSPDSCPCTSNCPVTSPADAPYSNGSSAEWIVERSANNSLGRFSTANCTTTSTCLKFDYDYVDRNNQQINIGVDPETAVTMYNYNVNPATELAFPGPVHNNNFFQVYWLRYS